MAVGKLLKNRPKLAQHARDLHACGVRRLYTLRNRRAFSALKQCEHPIGHYLAAAIADAENPRGHAAFSTIEVERARMLQDHTPLQVPASADTSEPQITLAEACLASKPARHGRLLHAFTRRLAPTKVLELGTNVGISSAYFADALATAADPGLIYTLDGSAARQAAAQQLHRGLNLGNVTYINGYFDHTLGPTLESEGPFDLIFIDGDHQFDPTMRYLKLVLSHTDRAITVLFDDIRWSNGMMRAWKQIASDSRFNFVADLYFTGVVHRPAGPVGTRWVAPSACV